MSVPSILPSNLLSAHERPTSSPPRPPTTVPCHQGRHNRRPLRFLCTRKPRLPSARMRCVVYATSHRALRNIQTRPQVVWLPWTKEGGCPRRRDASRETTGACCGILDTPVSSPRGIETQQHSCTPNLGDQLYHKRHPYVLATQSAKPA